LNFLIYNHYIQTQLNRVFIHTKHALQTICATTCGYHDHLNTTSFKLIDLAIYKKKPPLGDFCHNDELPCSITSSWYSLLFKS